MQVTNQFSGLNFNRNLETQIHRKLTFLLSRVKPYMTKVSIRFISAANTRVRSNSRDRTVGFSCVDGLEDHQ